jgi:hypothetical protein
MNSPKFEASSDYWMFLFKVVHEARDWPGVKW